MMRRTTIAAVSIALLLSGCAKPGGWYKAGTGDAEFRRDRGQCVAQAMGSPYNQAVVLAGCMQGKGWEWQTD